MNDKRKKALMVLNAQIEDAKISISGAYQIINRCQAGIMFNEEWIKDIEKEIEDEINQNKLDLINKEKELINEAKRLTQNND